VILTKATARQWFRAGLDWWGALDLPDCGPNKV
jgi:hypothetical protein